jgi:hypothetical protein
MISWTDEVCRLLGAEWHAAADSGLEDDAEEETQPMVMLRCWNN